MLSVTYSKALVDALGGECDICESEQKLIIHHTDGDDSNDSPDNLLLVCQGCHSKIHTKVEHGDPWDSYTEELSAANMRGGSGSSFTVRTSVSIEQEQKEWVDFHGLTLSKLVRDMLDDLMEGGEYE